MNVDDITAQVPIGATNAATSRAIWERVGQWKMNSISMRLCILACRGVIHEEKVPCRTGFKYLYWREAA